MKYFGVAVREQRLLQKSILSQRVLKTSQVKTSSRAGSVDTVISNG
jgi:hypothetical protein